MPPTPSELQERVRASQARYVAAVEGVDPTTLETVAVVGVWTPRDVTGNVIDWNWELLWAAQAALNGSPVEHHPIEDGEVYNRSQAAKRQGASWADTRAELDRSFDESVALLATLTPEQLAQPATPPWGGEAQVGNMFADIAGHTDEHAEQLEAWRATGEVQ
jgi:hypothetical protein